MKALVFILPACLRTGMRPVNIPSSLAKGLQLLIWAVLHSSVAQRCVYCHDN